jgi:hypothetical protein
MRSVRYGWGVTARDVSSGTASAWVAAGGGTASVPVLGLVLGPLLGRVGVVEGLVSSSVDSVTKFFIQVAPLEMYIVFMLYLSYHDGLAMLQWQARGAAQVPSSPGLKVRLSNSGSVAIRVSLWQWNACST